MDKFEPIDLFCDGTGMVSDDFESVSEENTVENEGVVSETNNDSSLDEQQICDSVESSDDTKKCTENCNDEVLEESEPLQVSSQLDEKIDQLLEMNANMFKQMESLSILFDKRIMYTNHEEKVIDNMHKELEKYKKDMYSQLLRPVLLSIIDVRESIIRLSKDYLAKADGEQDIPNKTFADYAFDLQDILEENSIEIYSSDIGSDFVPLKQKVLKKIPTEDANLHGKISESMSDGYKYYDKVIFPEKVSVYIYEAKPSTDEKNDNKIENSEVIDNG